VDSARAPESPQISVRSNPARKSRRCLCITDLSVGRIFASGELDEVQVPKLYVLPAIHPASADWLIKMQHRLDARLVSLN
jgi:hypothetical protein